MGHKAPTICNLLHFENLTCTRKCLHAFLKRNEISQTIERKPGSSGPLKITREVKDIVENKCASMMKFRHSSFIDCFRAMGTKSTGEQYYNAEHCLDGRLEAARIVSWYAMLISRSIWIGPSLTWMTHSMIWFGRTRAVFRWKAVGDTATINAEKLQGQSPGTPVYMYPHS
jgi:hypothetical protein